MSKSELCPRVPHKRPFTAAHRVPVILLHMKDMNTLFQNKALLIGNPDPIQYLILTKSYYWLVIHAYLLNQQSKFFK